MCVHKTGLDPPPRGLPDDSERVGVSGTFSPLLLGFCGTWGVGLSLSPEAAQTSDSTLLLMTSNQQPQPHAARTSPSGVCGCVCARTHLCSCLWVDVGTFPCAKTLNVPSLTPHR